MADVTTPFGFPYPEDTDLVRDGAQDIENLATGVNDYLDSGYLYAGTRYYTSSGTFDKADPLGTGDIGLRAIRVRMVGAGGAGGGAATTGSGQNALGRGGRGGTYAESFITDIPGLVSSVTVTRGAGGTGVSNAAGNAGGQSSFGSAVEAGGGGGGAVGGGAAPPGFNAGAIPAAGSATADLSVDGGVGFDALYLLAGFVLFGPGGGSLLGSGGAKAPVTTGADGSAGILYGGGGTGGSNAQNQGTARAGGAGANGIVIIDCFV
jgi:hypothetical protein